MTSVRAARVGGLLEAVAGGWPGFGRGVLAALTVAQAAALAGHAIRTSAGDHGLAPVTGEVAAACARLQDLGLVLAEATEAAHEDALAPHGGTWIGMEVLPEVGSAVVDVPVQIAEAAAEAARIAVLLFASIRRGPRAAAAAAALLASAAAATAASIVVENLGWHPEGSTSPDAIASVEAAREAAHRAGARMDEIRGGIPWLA